MMWVIDKRHDYWGDVISLGWHITGNKCEVVFTVKETTTFNIKTYSTNQTGDHATIMSLYAHGYSTLISGSTSLGDLTTGNINYETNVSNSKIERSSISNVQLTKGIPYRLVVERYGTSGALDFYLTISEFNRPDVYFKCENYSQFEVDSSKINPNLEENIGGGANCFGYAIAEYLNHVTGSEMLYRSVSASEDLAGLLEDISADYFNCIHQTYYSPDCIIAYGTEEDEYIHFAVSINGEITSKLGGNEPFVKHTTIDAYNVYTLYTFIVIRQDGGDK